MTDMTIRKTLVLPATKSDVWGYLTQADKLGLWFNPAEADLADGREYTLLGRDSGKRICWGKVTEMRPQDYMKWDFTTGPFGGKMTDVEWTLEDVHGGTRLCLVHSGLPDGAEGLGLLTAFDKGWHDFLGKMHALVA